MTRTAENEMTAITLDRSVVEQVLEALEEADLLMDHRQNVELRRSALVTLRAALEQQQVAQQPVAWYWTDSKGWIEYGPEEHDRYSCDPLYLHPQPPRQPLTDEQIEKICPSFDDPMRSEMWKIGFKAAHKIKDNT